MAYTNLNNVVGLYNSTDTEYKEYFPLIYTNNTWKCVEPYVYDGTTWRRIGGVGTLMIPFITSDGEYFYTSDGKLFQVKNHD